MGLKTGDRLVAINDRRLDGDAAPADVLRDAVREGPGAVRLVAARGKSRIELDGQADGVGSPAYPPRRGRRAAGSRAGRSEERRGGKERVSTCRSAGGARRAKKK